MRQIGLSMTMYVDENNGFYAPRAHPKRWPERLRSGYRDLKLLVCPTDGPNPGTGEDDADQWPADAAPRSYIYNGWNDFYAPLYNNERNWRKIVATNELAIREVQIREPASTTIFGEKDNTSGHWYFDYETYEDIYQLDQNRHITSRRREDDKKTGDGGGGSNYILADGSARYFAFSKTFDPVNLWAITEEWRTINQPSN